MTDFEKAIFMFQKLHEFLPGDFPNTNIWLAEDIANTCYKITDEKGTVATGADRPDQDFIKGNGDGLLMDWESNGSGDAELVTCHLALSGMLNASDHLGLGIRKEGNGYTAHETKYKSGYFVNNIDRLALVASGAGYYSPKENCIILGGSFTKGDSDQFARLSAATIETMMLNFATLKAIDMKIDDGKPGAGKVIFGSYSHDTGLCSEFLSSTVHYCAPSAVFSATTAKNKKGMAWLIYRPSWLNSNW